MQLEKGFIYHIYNQGNNRNKVFFEQENYLYFLKKARTYILPYADIIAWCLMPNHFHFMVLVNSEALTQSQGFTKNKKRTFNESLGIMLRTYTRAINKQENRTGAIFRRKTKAECLNCPGGISPSFISKNGITQIKSTKPEKEYPQICFNYIHQNPVKANLVKTAIEWEYSSAKGYSNLRKGQLINKLVAKKYVLWGTVDRKTESGGTT